MQNQRANAAGHFLASQQHPGRCLGPSDNNRPWAGQLVDPQVSSYVSQTYVTQNVSYKRDSKVNYERYISADNKENRGVYPQQPVLQEVHDSPKRVIRSKSSFSYNTNSYLSPNSKFEVDREFMNQDGVGYRNVNEASTRSQKTIITNPKRLLFKFKVYATKVEKWQIDERGNEIPGGLLEVMQGNSTSIYPSSRFQPQEILAPPPFKLMSSRYVNLPLPRESQELLAANIREYNKIVERQMQLVSQPNHNQETLDMIRHSEQERLSLFKNQVDIVKEHLPEDKYYSQLVGSDHMATAQYREHPARTINTGTYKNSDRTESLVSDINMAQVLKVPMKIHHESGTFSNTVCAPGIFDSLVNQAHGIRSPREYPNGESIYTNQEFENKSVKATDQSNYKSNEHPAKDIKTSARSDRQSQGQQTSPRLLKENSNERLSPPRSGQKTMNNFTSDHPIATSELHSQTISHEIPDRGMAVASKDFNDWIEKGLFRQIENRGSNPEGIPKGAENQAILSLIPEVPEDKSDSSPQKGNRSSQKMRLIPNRSSFEEQTNGASGPQKLLAKSKQIGTKEGSFYSSSSYPQENFEDGKGKKSQLIEEGEGQAFGHNPRYSDKYLQSIPVISTQRISSEENQQKNQAIPWLSPVKVMGSVYISQSRGSSNFKSKHMIEEPISEVKAEEEDEGTQDRHVKLMTPQQSGDFKPHKINTDCSCSMSHDVYSHEHGNHNLNVAFPSLKFSSARLDKSIQVRTSLNICEGQSIQLECNNFIYLDQAADERSHINAYMIEPIHVQGYKAERKMQNEQVQTDMMSPFIATQVVEELLKSRDFASEIRRSAAQQPFTVTVEQDEENNDYVINVHLSHEMNDGDHEQEGVNDYQLKDAEGRNTFSENEQNLRLASRTESIREMSELGHTNHLLNFDWTKKQNLENSQNIHFGKKIDCGPIAEKDEQEGSVGSNQSSQDDQVTIDNPLLKEYDATASPDQHARNSRLEEIFQEGGYKSATSDVMAVNNQHFNELEHHYQEDRYEEGYYFQQPNFAKTHLCQITEKSAEESEQLRMSRQLNMASVEHRDNQSEVFNSRAYERLFGEPSQVSDSKYDRSKKGQRSMTAYHSKEQLNVINEENPTQVEPTNSFVEFLAKKDNNGSRDATLNSGNNTPKKKPVEIEDIILDQSKSKVKESGARASSKLVSRETSNKRISTADDLPVFDCCGIEPTFLECRKEHIYAIRHCEKRVKKCKSSRSIKRQQNEERGRSRTPNPDSKKQNLDENKSADISQITDQERPDMITLQIPDKDTLSKRTIVNKNKSKDNSIDFTAQNSKNEKKTDRRRTPTPNKTKENLSTSDLRSVSQIKKELADSSANYGNNKGTTVSPISQKTQKKVGTPIHSKNNSISEKPKAGKRETSPYAPEKYKNTIQTLFHDQMGPSRKKAAQKPGFKGQEDELLFSKQKTAKIDASLTHFNQVSDCDTYSITSGNAKDFMKGHGRGYNKTKSFAEKAVNQNNSLVGHKYVDDALEAEVNKSHRSTRSHFPQQTRGGMAPLFEDVVAEQESTGKKNRGLKAASYTNVSNKKPSATQSKAGSPQLGFQEVHQKFNKPSESNSLSKHSQGKHSAQTFGHPDHYSGSRPQSQRQSFARNSHADNLLRDRILNEFITGLCSTGILNEEDCSNENFFIENEAIMIGFDGMVAVCAEMGFLPDSFDPENSAFGR